MVDVLFLFFFMQFGFCAQAVSQCTQFLWPNLLGFRASYTHKQVNKGIMSCQDSYILQAWLLVPVTDRCSKKMEDVFVYGMLFLVFSCTGLFQFHCMYFPFLASHIYSQNYDFAQALIYSSIC